MQELQHKIRFKDLPLHGQCPSVHKPIQRPLTVLDALVQCKIAWYMHDQCWGSMRTPWTRIPVNHLKMYIVFFITMIIEDLVIFFEVTVFFIYCTLHLHLFILKSAILFILYILIKSGLHKFKYLCVTKWDPSTLSKSETLIISISQVYLSRLNI